MKFIKIISVMIAAVLLLSVAATIASAQENNYTAIIESQMLRAGGGGGGGGGGSGGGASGGRYTSGNSTDSPVETVLSFLLLPFISFGAAIVLRIRIIKASFKTKRFIKSIEKNAPEWCYKDIKKQVRNAYFLIQKSWTDMDMTPAKAVMSDKLFESF